MITVEQIKQDLQTAAFVDRMMPKIRPPKASGWQFEIIYSQQEMELMERKPPKLNPTPEQIDTWERVVLDWFMILEPEERQLAWKRANHIPWKFLCREFGYGRADVATFSSGVNKNFLLSQREKCWRQKSMRHF